MANSQLSLEDPEYVTVTRAKWGQLPIRMKVIEFFGDGDPFFGGNSDDRVLGESHLILESNSQDKHAIFENIEAAHEAAKKVSNRRANSILGVVPYWR